MLTATLEDPTVQTEADRCRVFGQRDHCRIYARDYADRLSGSGFNVEVFRWTDHPTTFGGDGNRFALNPEESVYACRKPGVIADAV